MLEAGGLFFPAAGLVNGLWEECGVLEEDRRGAFRADPLGSWSKGSLVCSLDEALDQMVGLVGHTRSRLPGVPAIGIDSSVYSGAGADESFDLACSVATGVAYLKVLDEAGVSLEEACRQMVFTYCVGCDIFLSIAKLRAARRLWSRIIQACGGQTRGMRMMVRSGPAMMTRRSAWLNLVRTTISGFAAAVGGAQMILLFPYDQAQGLGGSFSRRLAPEYSVLVKRRSRLRSRVRSGQRLVVYREFDRSIRAASLGVLSTD